MPASICARVPKKTSKMDSANSSTVSRSEAIVSSRRTTGFFSRRRGRSTAWTSAGGAGAAAAGVGGAVLTERSLIGGSGEFHGLHEGLEGSLVLADHGRAAE